MVGIAHFLSLYMGWFAIPCLAITSIIFCIRQGTKESLIFASGIVLIAFGSLIQIFSPLGRLTMDEAGKILSSSPPPISWYAGSIITSIGLFVTVVGLAAVTWKVKGKAT